MDAPDNPNVSSRAALRLVVVRMVAAGTLGEVSVGSRILIFSAPG